MLTIAVRQFPRLEIGLEDHSGVSSLAPKKTEITTGGFHAWDLSTISVENLTLRKGHEWKEAEIGEKGAHIINALEGVQIRLNPVGAQSPAIGRTRLIYLKFSSIWGLVRCQYTSLKLEKCSAKTLIFNSESKSSQPNL